MTYMNNWNADAFHLNTISGGNPLVSSSYMIFKNRNLFTEFQVLPRAFINFVSSIQVSNIEKGEPQKLKAQIIRESIQSTAYVRSFI